MASRFRRIVCVIPRPPRTLCFDFPEMDAGHRNEIVKQLEIASDHATGVRLVENTRDADGLCCETSAGHSKRNSLPGDEE